MFCPILRFTILLLSLSMTTSSVFCQDKIDSLKNLLNSSTPDSLRHTILINMGNEFIRSSPSSADSIFNESYKVAKKLNDRKRKALSKYRMGWNTLSQNKFNEALPLVLESVKLTENEDLNGGAEHAGYNMTAGWLYDKVGDYYAALNHYNTSEEIFSNLDKRNNVANVLINKGIIYDRLNNKEKALEYYLKCKEEYEAVKDSTGLVYAYNNIGHIAYKNGEFSEAIKFYAIGLEIAILKEKHAMSSTIFQNLGKTHSDQGNIDSSIEAYKNSIKYTKKIGDRRSEAYAQIELEELYVMKIGKPVDLSLVHSALDLAESYGDIDLQKRACEILFDTYKGNRDYQYALKYKEQLDVINDSISSDALRLKIENLEISRQFETEKFQNKLQKQTLESNFQSQIQTKNYFRNLLLTILGLTLLFILLIYRNYRKLLTTSIDLEQKNADLKEAEIKLEKKNKDLEKYIDLNIELEQFAHIVSHDIKSPLRTISSYIGLLKKKIVNKVNDEDMGYLDVVEHNSKRLNELVNDLLLYTKANADNLNLSSFKLSDLFSEVIDDVEFRVAQSHPEIKQIGIDKEIVADRIKLKLILQNLVDNALKFSSHQKLPKVHITLVEDESYYTISITDNGIGIPPEYKHKVFNKFTQLNPKDTYEGTGLGLSIVKNYIEKHAGNVHLEDGIDGGCQFTFTLSKNLKEPN